MGMLVARITVFFCFAAWGECGIEAPRTGTLTLPAGTTVLREPIVVAAGSQDLVIAGAPGGSFLKASARFTGKALIVIEGGARISVRNVRLDGSRTASTGIVAGRITEFSVENVRLSQIAGFAVSVSESRKVRILRVEVSDSGGIRAGDGTQDFHIRQCKLNRVRGAAIQIDSEQRTPRNRDGWIEENEIQRTSGSAILVSDSVRIRVERNQGRETGFLREPGDRALPGQPMAIETAGEVAESFYALNTFEETNGVCIGLDGFHHGEVRRNRCVNQKPVTEYPLGGAGIVMGESGPDVRSEAVRILDNELEGIKQGGIVVTGRSHRIEKNRMRFLNQAGDPGPASSGVYLSGMDGRKGPVEEITIADNLITGRNMKLQCIGLAPGVDPGKQTQERNICLDAVWVKPKKAAR